MVDRGVVLLSCAGHVLFLGHVDAWWHGRIVQHTLESSTWRQGALLEWDARGHIDASAHKTSSAVMQATSPKVKQRAMPTAPIASSLQHVVLTLIVYSCKVSAK